MSNYDSDEDTISTMGYQDNSTHSNNSLTSSSGSSSSDGSRVIALTTASNSEYDDSTDDDFELVDDPEDDDATINAIFQDDNRHLDSDKNDGCYYVGIYKHISKSGNFLYINSVSGNIFTKYPVDKIQEYLHSYSIMLRRCSSIEIMQLYIRNDVYYVVLKTFWIRIIQRLWRQRVDKYKQNQEKKMLPKNMRYKEIHGKYPKELNYLPKLHGMLSHYKKP